MTLGEAPGMQSVAASATDHAGNVGHDSVGGLKVDLSDPATPAFFRNRRQDVRRQRSARTERDFVPIDRRDLGLPELRRHRL